MYVCMYVCMYVYVYVYVCCRDTIYIPSPRYMGSWPNEPNTINL